MYLLTAIALFLIIPAGLSLFQGEKDRAAVSLLIGSLLIGVFFAAYPYIHQLRSYFPEYGLFIKLAAAVSLSMAVILALRLKNQFLTGMLCTAAALLVLMSFRIIHHGLPT